MRSAGEDIRRGAAVSWVGILVPAQTPKVIVDKLNSEMVAVLREPAIRERFAALGIEPVGNSSAEFGEQIKADLVRWQRVVERGNIKVD